ncbi:hypothetical protein [Sphingobium sp. BS19]|uniref:hypothetical protein n=1 Tax=Sphingobium sp. BS19 TaxID=3018973 RepID=UPI0022ED7CAB|nr:hypothetical protein [Sphingobium sp. BS19]GLI99012.1 hypothetical protein Sbs19_28300 [Sphingobium sp. BS19]
MSEKSTQSDQHASVVLDNAILFSAANYLVRHDGGNTVRNVNLFGLSGLVDALVMHQRITVDRAGWEYFADAVPATWLPSIQPMLNIVDFALPPQETVVDAVMQSSNSILLSYALTVIDQSTETEGGRDLNTTYFSYTGSDLGRNRNEQELVSLLQDRLELAIPPMHLHLRSYDHVSALQSLVRAVQYQCYATELGQAYLPHDFRGRIINVMSRDRVEPAFRSMWERLMARVTTNIEKAYNEKLEWSHFSDDGSFALWEKFQMPTFLTMALEKTKEVGDLFHHVLDLRNKAMPLRHLIEQYSDVDSVEKAAAIALDVRRVSHELDSVAPAKPTSVFSVAIGFPPSVSLRMNLPSSSAKRSVAFVRDIYDNHAVPLCLARDMGRVFGSVTQPLTLDPLLEVAPGENVIDSFFANTYSKSTGEKLV